MLHNYIHSQLGAATATSNYNTANVFFKDCYTQNKCFTKKLNGMGGDTMF